MPNSNIPTAELERDHAETEKDINHLSAIVHHLRAFIHDTDEDRRSFRLDLMRYESLLAEGERLRAKIESLRTQPHP